MTARRSVWKSSVSSRYREDHRFFAVIGLQYIKQTFAVINNLRVVTSVLLLVAILWAGLAAAIEARAQETKPGVVGFGDLVVTGASGTLPPPANPPLPPGVNELDETFIDPGGASLKVFDVSNPGGPPEAQLLNAPVKFQAFARDIGQVFGLAIDDAVPPNIYAASTSVHGLQIVLPDADGDGRPERLKLGQPGAQWMDGQFGVARGGGPGTVWKINGSTGEISKFADIASGGVPNSGPGLGNIAYDPAHKQFFVSDLDTGLIHRLDMSGIDVGTFDHGVNGRPANALDPVPDDAGQRLDITNPAFDAEDPESWAMADRKRRVWGVAYHNGRLYYATVEGPQIWSVGIGADGSFGDDPRWELDINPEPRDHPVSDIAFTTAGQMTVAQRGGITSRYDYSQFHAPRQNRVLRFSPETPDDPETPGRWVAEPGEYAVGFSATHRNSAGGVALGYAYQRKPDGSYGFGACGGTLWTTGDALRDNPVHAARLAQGGPLNVHGLQGNALSLVRPKNVPPWESYFVDFDGQFDDPQAAGHVGDVEIAESCWKPKAEKADLSIIKRALPDRCDARGDCTFAAVIENVGSDTYSGPLHVRDTAEGGTVLVSHAPPDWQCEAVFDDVPGTYECSHGPVELAPGQSITLELTFTLPGGWDPHVYKNCVELITPGIREDARRYNNRSCDYVGTEEPGGPLYGPDIQIEKYAIDPTCDVFGNCPFVVLFTNVGNANYTGPLSISDVVTQPGTTLVNWFGHPAWICAAGGAPQSYDCTLPIPVTLSPGETVELILVFQGPPLVAGFTHVRNCAQFEWQGVARDFNPGNEFACAEIYRYPPGHPGAVVILEVNKKALPTCMQPGGAGTPWLCLYRVEITNTGGIPYDQPFEVMDEPIPHPGYTLAGFAPPEWTCAPGVGAGGPQTCTHPPVAGGGLMPGESLELDLYYELPAGVPTPSVERNCARLMWDSDGDGAPEPHEACADSLICQAGVTCPPDLAVLKFAPAAPCDVGNPCPFDLRVQNISGILFPGSLTLDEVPGTDVGPPTFVPGGWACVPAGGTYNCTNPIAIPPGGWAVWQVSFDLPPDYPAPSFENCARSTVPDVWPDNNEDCAIAQVPAPDLAPWSPSSCERGSNCPLDVEIDNRGSRPFKGAMGLKGMLSPGVQISSITSGTPGMTCKVTGFGTYECNAPSVEIPPHGAATLKFVAVIPSDFPHDAITHTKEMIWPDRTVKDKKPENDKHVSTIEILGPKEEEKKPEEPKPEEPPQPEQGPDLAVTKIANQDTCGQGQPCGFVVTVTHQGGTPYTGLLRISDTITPPGARLTFSGPPPWSCRGSGGSYSCTHPSTTLQPGESKTLSLTFSTPRGNTQVIENCAMLVWGEQGSQRDQVRAVQQALNEGGFNAGSPDGKVGRKTRNAVRAFQEQAGLPVTGQIDDALVAALLGPAGEGDTNPANDRACASSGIQVTGPPPCTGGRYRNNKGQCVCPTSTPYWNGQSCVVPPPAPCTGGRFRNNKGQCVCPSNKPIWTGQICIPQPPKPCTGGRYRNNQGQCVCPSDKPNWSGSFCFAKEILCSGGRIRVGGRCVCPSNKPIWTGQICIPTPGCTGGRIRNNKGQCVCPANKPIWSGKECIPGHEVCSGGRIYSERLRKCVCPANKPIWTGKSCISQPTCTGGRIRNNKGQCVCPSNLPVWTGQICIPKITICSGGRVFSLSKKKCVCPSNKPVWSGSQCNPAHQVCSGGRTYSERLKKCVCPSNKPYWTGSSCTQYTTNPGFPKPPPQQQCTGGRYRNNKGQCVCPSSKPVWTGQVCIPAKIKINPNLQLQIPQLQLKKK